MSSEEQSLFSEHVSHLPQYFAENLLYLEMEVELNNVSIEIVNQLLELYRIGVEYFESIKSEKFLIFKNRTTQLLIRPIVNQCMTEAYEERKNEESLKKSTNGLPPTPGNRLKQKEMQIQMQYIQHEDQQQRVNQLVENHSNQSERTNNMINQELQMQNDQMQRRLERRRQHSVRIKGQRD